MGLRAASSEKRRWYRTLWSHTVAHSRKHCSTLWWHCSCTQWRTLVAHSGGSTVRPQRAICHRGLLCCCLYLLLSVYSKPVCSTAPPNCLVSSVSPVSKSQSARFADFLAASLLLPQSRCQRTMSSFSNIYQQQAPNCK